MFERYTSKSKPGSVMEINRNSAESIEVKNVSVFIRGLVILSLLFITGSVSAETWYVDINSGADSTTGTSWETAFKSLYQAVDSVSGGEGDTIKVAEGIYNTDQDGYKFYDAYGCVILGGYSGGPERERDYNQYETVLMGDEEVDYGVVEFIDSNIVFDGFTVNGNNNRGICSWVDSITVSHCR
ncbi:MAG: hypothetical protein ACOCSE_00735, partial [Chitinivibrionales bacterium]